MPAAPNDDAARIATWFGPSPGVESTASWARHFLQTPPVWQRERLGGILEEAVVEDGGSAASRRSAQLLRQTGSVAIVTGQQPAVGGGPLYTLVKIAHAIATAQAVATAGVAASPVFWCASEDHDLGEAGHADLVLDNGEIQRFSADLGGGKASLRFRPARRWWPAFVAHCRRHLGNGPGADWLQASAPDGEEGLGAWQCRLLSRLFAEHGLVCIEGHHLRPLWSAQVERALDRWPAAELARRRDEILAAGHADAFGPLDHPPLFADRPTGREPLTVDAARALLGPEPELLSPGAALRPVLQQAALPAAVYVAGPGEFAYHAFIGPVYAALEVPRPMLIRRCSLSLLPTRVSRGLRRWGIAADALKADTPMPPGGESSTAIATQLAGLDAALAGLEVATPVLADDPRRRLTAALVRLRRHQQGLRLSLARGARRTQQLPPFGQLRSFLFPKGVRQERVLCLAQALWQHGPSLAGALVTAATATAPGQHGFVPVA